MLIIQERYKNNPGEIDRVVALLKNQSELIKRLIYDIETDYLSPQVLKERILEIENHCRKLNGFN